VLLAVNSSDISPFHIISTTITKTAPINSTGNHTTNTASTTGSAAAVTSTAKKSGSIYFKVKQEKEELGGEDDDYQSNPLPNAIFTPFT